LLEAFAADLGQKRTTVSELCQATIVPQSVAIRWIKKLEQDEWLSRSQDEQELELTAQGAARLRRYFEVVGSALLLV
jgi:DNA-binding IclR family transcriptional regulator